MLASHLLLVEKRISRVATPAPAWPGLPALHWPVDFIWPDGSAVLAGLKQGRSMLGYTM
jgi:hypothetical protein